MMAWENHCDNGSSIKKKQATIGATKKRFVLKDEIEFFVKGFEETSGIPTEYVERPQASPIQTTALETEDQAIGLTFPSNVIPQCDLKLHC